MKFTFQLDINISIPDYAEQLKGKAWLDGAIESAREFAVEVKNYIEKHPFVEGCKLSEKITQHSP